MKINYFILVIGTSLLLNIEKVYSTKLTPPGVIAEILPPATHNGEASADLEFDTENHQLHAKLLSAVKKNQSDRMRDLLKQGADPLYCIGDKRIIDYAQKDTLTTLLAHKHNQGHDLFTAMPSAHTNYQIEWDKEAKKQFDRLQRMEQAKIEKALDIAANQSKHHIKKLQGKQPFLYRIAVGKRLRVGFNYRNDGTGIIVMYAGYHENCYE